MTTQNIKKFLGVQNPFFKKGFGRRRHFLFIFLCLCFLPFGLFSQGIDITGNSTINRCETNSYTIELQNDSGNTLSNLVIVARLENLTGFSYVTGSSLLNINGGGDNPVGNPTISGAYTGLCTAPVAPYLTWNIDSLVGATTLLDGQTISITFNLQTACNAVSGSLNTLIDYQISGTPMCDNTGVLNIQVNPGAVTIKKTPNVIPQELGQNVTWTLTVENTGFGVIKNVKVTDNLGAGLSYVSCTEGGVNVGQITTWDAAVFPALAEMAPGTILTMDITSQVVQCEFLDNVADVRFGCDAVTDCFNTATDGGTATASVQRIVKTPLISYTPPNITFNYCEDYVDVSFTISNVGDGRAHSVWTVVDFSPLTVTNVSAGTIYNATDHRFEHTDPILPGGNYVLSFRLNYASWCGGTFPAKDLLWQKVYEDDCHQLFYPPVEMSVINPPVGAVSLALSKSGAGSVIQIGDVIAYTITSSYTGPLTCGSGSTGTITVVDSIPTGFVVIDADGGTYVPGGGGTGGTITWTYLPPTTLSRTITVQSPLIANCETYCNTIFTNSVSASGVDCCGCALTANASETSAIECAEGVTSQKVATGPTQRCADITYTNTYTFDGGSTATLNNLLFTEHAENQQVYNNNLSITLDGVDISGSVLMTDTTPGGSLVFDFSGGPATPLAGRVLVIQYNLTATAATVAACTNSTFYSWSSLSMGASGSSCLGDGVIHETTPVTIGSPSMSLAITGLGAIFHKCESQQITLTLRQTSTFNPKDVKLKLSGLNYYVIDPTNPAAITCSGDVSPVACLPVVDGNGDYNWTFNDLFTGQNQTATIVLNVQKRCTGTGDLVATAYFDDLCTDDATSDELCSVTATETPTLLLSGDLLIEKTPEVYYATTNTVQWVIYLTNRGTGTAYNVWVDDVLGAGLLFTSAVVDDMTGVTVTGNLNHSGSVINGANIAITDMTAGERRMITFTAEVIDCNNLTNLATTSWGCIGVDCQVAVTDTSTVKIPAPNLINTNTITPSGGVNACDSPDGFITLRNAGQVTCYNLQVTETLPAGLLYVTGTTRWRLNSGVWNGPNVAYDPVPTTSPLVWTKTQIPGLATSNPGDTIEIEFQMISDCPFLGGDLKVATQYENPCADVFTNAESKFTVAYHAPVITVTKTRANDPIDCNQDITWNITVTNNSGYAMPIVWVEDTMDAAYTYVSSTGNAPYTSDNGTNVFQKVTWELENIPTGTTVNLTLTAHTDSSPCSPDLDNTVQAWWGCGNPDGDSGTKPGVDETGSNICLGATGVSAVRTETRQPSVGYMNISLSPASIDSCNDDTQMTLVLVNSGDTDASDLDLVVTLPVGLSYNAGSSLMYQGVDDTGVTAPIGDPNIVGSVLTYYNVGDRGIDLVNTLEKDGGNDTIVLKFSVKSSCYTTQNVGLNLRYYDCCGLTQYSTTSSPQVTALYPVLSVVKSVSPSTVDCGNDVTWTVAVSNTGTGNAEVIRVVDTLGDWLDYAGNFTEDQPGTITPAVIGGNPQVIGWEMTNLAAGTTATFTFDATLNPDGLPNQNSCAVALRQNNVTAQWACGTSGDATDDNPNTVGYDCTNSGSATAGPITVPMPDLLITTITPGISCTTGDGVFSGTVSVTVQNQGTAATLAGFTVSVTDGTWTGTGTTGVLAAGASVTVTINTSGWGINCHSCTPYTLDATVDSTLAVCECNEANNTSSLSYTPPLPDFKVNSITPTCTADGRLRVRVNISNVGCANSTANFIVHLVDDQGHSADSTAIPLNAGASTNVDFSNWVSACSPATVNFTATVDNTNTNCECDSDNSLVYAYNNTLPNLVVSTITPSTSCTGDGTVSGTIAVQISNTGNGAVTADFRIAVNDGQGWTATPWYNATLGGTLPLAAGANATVNVPWTRGFTTAAYTCNFPTITVTLDSTSVICECSNASNASTSSYSMTYPNLRITSVTPSCTPGGDGTYSVAVVVNNNGCGTATNAVVRVSDNDGQTSDQTVTLAAGASQTLTYAPWPADGNPATLTFTTTLDPGTAICELTGTDNTNSTNFTRGNLNLVSITPACTADGTYQVSLVIQNNGSAAINTNFVVRLTDNDGHTSDQNFTAIGGTLPFNNGTSQTVVFSGWTVDCNPTTINFSGALDPTNLICESNSGDNTNTGTVTINDLQAVSVVPATSCTADGTITGTMVVTVANNGGNAINSDFRILVSDGQGWTSELRYNVDLGGTLPIAAGTSQSVTFNWTRSFSATPYVCSFPSISVTVDSQSAICECSSSNNSNTASYSMPYPNLNVVSVTPTCNSDGSYSIAVTVSNTGCGTATNAVVRLSDNDGQTADQTVTLAAGASSTLTYAPWPADGNPAALTFTATIDPAAALCELTGDDHSEVVTYDNPNLRIVLITPDCSADGTYSVSLEIENSGTGNVTSDFVVRLADNDGHTVNQNFTAIGGTLPLTAGTQQTVVFTPWTVDGNPTTINFTGTLDPTNQICESNNTDNTGTGTFTINDLNAVSVVAATSCASDGSITGTMVVTVSNLGGNAINSDFSILVNDGQGWTSELLYNTDLGGTLPIAAGATASVTFNWTRAFTATPYVCSFTSISASIDSQNAICEVTSGNNGATTTYTLPYPNLNLVSVTPTCNSDGSYAIAVTVSNNGCGTATNAVVRLSDNDGQTDDQTVTLAAGASSTLTYSPWLADGNPAALTFTAVIDPAAAICELTGDDHTEVVTYNTPNLRIVSITPDCTADGSYRVSLIIENNGTADINTNFVVRLADNDGRTVNQNFTAIGGTLPLVAGTQQTVVFNPWTVDGNPTTINFTGTLDPTNLICESNNSDNGGSGTFTINDLNAVSVVAATSCASDGSITGTMVVTVSNLGGNAITNDFSILVNDGQGWTSELRYNADLGGTLPIAPGASSSVTFNWTRAFSATPYICSFPGITVSLDSQNGICEVTNGNNGANTTYSLPYPNLRAISVTPTCNSDGTYSIAVVVDNNGCGTATNAVVRLSDNDGHSVDQTVTLVPGVPQTLTFSSWPVDGNPAALIFTAEIDPDDAICELTDPDTVGLIPNHIVIITYNNPNLHLVSITPTCTGDTTYRVDMVIENNGTANITSDFVVRLADNDGHTLDRNFTAIGGTLPLTAGTQQTVSFNNWTVDCNPLTITFSGTLDPTDQICESNSTDDASTGITITVNNLNAVSVVATTSCTSDGTITGSMVVTVSNIGGNPITNDFRILVNDGQGWTSELWYQTNLGGTLPIAVGASSSVTIPWTRNFTATPYVCTFSTITATVDSQGDICECNSVDNVTTSTYTLPYPDLTITTVGSSVTCLGDGSLTGTTVTVRNGGCAGATGVVIRLASDCGLTFNDQTVDLAAGESKDVFFAFTSGIVSCTCNFNAIIDPDALICELDGTNNTGSSVATMLIPDLEVQSEATLIACATDGVFRVSGTVTLVNNGCGPNFTGNVPMRFTLFNRTGCTGTQIAQWVETFNGVDIVSAGGTQVFTIQPHDINANFFTSSTNCMVSLRIEADYNNTICEWDGTDNTLCVDKTSDCLDLEAVEIKATTACVADGNFNRSLAFTLRNSGGKPITHDFTIKVDDGHGWSAEKRYNADLGGPLPLTAGTSATVTFNWNRTIDTTTCDFGTITAQVDTQNEICQGSTDNDTVTTSYEMPYANLKPTAIVVSCSTDGFYTAKVTITNDGCADCGPGNFTVRMQDNLGNGFDQVISTSTLTKGASYTVEFNQWPAACDPDEITFTAIVDTKNTVCEIRGDDNQLSFIYKNISPDLVITTLTPAAICSTPGNISGSLTLTLLNQGNGPVTQDFKVTCDDGAGWTTEKYYAGDLGGSLPIAANETVIIRIPWTRDFTKAPFTCNFNNIKVSLDVQTGICECKAENNETTATYNLPFTDLKLDSLAILCQKDGQKQMQFTVGNDGCEDQRDDFNITISEIVSGLSKTLSFTALGGKLPLSRGTTQTIIYEQWTFDCTATATQFKVSLGAGSFCDLRGENNSTAVAQSTLEPDLLLENVDWTCNADGTITFRVSVANLGSGNASNVPITVYDHTGKAIFTRTIDLTPGAHAQFTFTTAPYPTNTSMTFRFLMDESDIICECNGANNEKAVTVNCSGGTNKPILEISKTCPPGQQPGGLFRFEIHLNNKAQSDLTQVVIEDFLPAGFQYVNGSSVWNTTKLPDPQITDRLTWIIPSLVKGTSGTLMFSAVTNADIDPGRYCNTAQAKAHVGDQTGVEVSSELTECCTVVTRENGMGCCLNVEEWAMTPFYKPDSPLSLIEPYFRTDSSMFTVYSIFKLWKDQNLEPDSMPRFMKERLLNYARSNIEEFYLTSRLGLTLEDHSLWLSAAGAYPEQNKQSNAGNAWVHHQVDETMTLSQVAFELLALNEGVQVETNTEVKQKLHTIIQKKLTFLSKYMSDLPHAWELKVTGKETENGSFNVRDLDGDATLYDKAALFLAVTELQRNGYVDWVAYDKQLRPLLKSLDNTSFDRNNRREEFLFIMALHQSGQPELLAQAKAKMLNFEEIFANDKQPPEQGHQSLDNIADYSLAVYLDRSVGGTLFPELMKRMKEKFYLADTGIYADKQPDFTYKLQLRDLAPLILAFDSSAQEEQEQYATVLYRTFDEVGLFLKKRNLMEGNPLYSLLRNYPFSEPLLPVLSFTKAKRNIAPVFSRDAVVHSTLVKPLGEILIPGSYTKILSPVYETSSATIANVSFGLQYLGQQISADSERVNKEEGRSLTERGKTYMDSLLVSGAGYLENNKVLIPFDNIAIIGPKQAEHNLEPMDAGFTFSSETLANYLLAEKHYVANNGKQAQAVQQLLAQQFRIIEQLAALEFIPLRFQLYIENASGQITLVPSVEPASKMTVAKLMHVSSAEKMVKQLASALKKAKGQILPEDLVFLSTAPEVLPYFKEELTALVDPKDASVTGNTADILARQLLGQDADKIQKSMEKLAKQWDKVAIIPQSDDIETIEKGLVSHHTPGQFMLYLLAMNSNVHVNVNTATQTSVEATPEFRFKRTLNLFTYLLENEWGLEWDNANSFITLPSADYQVFKEEPRENAQPGDRINFRVRVDNTCPEGLGIGRDLSSLYLKATFTPSLLYVGTQAVDGLDVIGDFQWHYNGFPQGSLLEYVYQAHVPNEFAFNYIDGTIYAGGRLGLDEQGGTNATNDCEDLHRVRRFTILPYEELQGLVFEDRNVNGIKDVGEPGIPNILLKDTRGRMFRSDAEGRFTVFAGDEHEGVQIELKSVPANFILRDNPTKLINRHYTGMIYFSLIPCKTLTGFVYQDENENGSFDTSETRPAGVVLKAKDKEVVTAPDGQFIFRNLPVLWQEWVEIKKDQPFYKKGKSLKIQY